MATVGRDIESLELTQRELWLERKGEQGLRDYVDERNATSIDGLPGEAPDERHQRHRPELRVQPVALPDIAEVFVAIAGNAGQ